MFEDGKLHQRLKSPNFPRRLAREDRSSRVVQSFDHLFHLSMARLELMRNFMEEVSCEA